MADYFLVLDGAWFEGEARPALAAAWLRRDFAPCRALAMSLLPAARAYAARYHTGPAEPLLAAVAGELAFDRTLWRGLAGEVLLYGAADIPEFPICPDTLCRLLSPDRCATDDLPRAELPPILQAHRGSRDLTFGPAVYRPDHAGYNAAADVARLADYLAAVRPDQWAAADVPAADVADARDWFPALAALYARARGEGQVVVVESIY
jgi:hypothetical protein